MDANELIKNISFCIRNYGRTHGKSPRYVHLSVTEYNTLSHVSDVNGIKLGVDSHLSIGEAMLEGHFYYLKTGDPYMAVSPPQVQFTPSSHFHPYVTQIVGFVRDFYNKEGYPPVRIMMTPGDHKASGWPVQISGIPVEGNFGLPDLVRLQGRTSGGIHYQLTSPAVSAQRTSATPFPNLPINYTLYQSAPGGLSDAAAKPAVCTCGTDKAGGGKHSSWCDKP